MLCLRLQANYGMTMQASKAITNGQNSKAASDQKGDVPWKEKSLSI